MPKYKVGQPIEITGSRFQGEDYEYYPYIFKYKDGDKGYISQRYDTVADIPVDLF